MPELLLASSLSPTAAARAAVARALAEDSQFPILAAVNLLLAACREADRRDPAWRSFLWTLSQAEIDLIGEATTRIRELGRVHLRFV